MEVWQDRLKQFFERFPLLLPTIRPLNEQKIPWAIGGSGCLFLLGNERSPDDVDVFLRDEDHDAVDALFGVVSVPYVSPLEQVRNSRPWNEHSIQLTSALTLSVEGKTHGIRITDAVMDHRIPWVYEGEAGWLLAPEDVLLIKGILQRGPSVGKHDVVDVERFLALYPAFDRAYFAQRVQEVGASERIKQISCL